MKPLKVAYLVKQSPSTRLRETRNMGYMSYPVEQFTWEHDTPNTGEVHLDLYRNYDVVIQEDAGNYRIARTQHSPPLVYLCIDSTLSEQHYQARLERARQADLVLVDHDDLQHFKISGKPVRRLHYCVNNWLFYPAPIKDIDLNFHCGGGASRGIPGGVERAELRSLLGEIAHEWDLKYVSGGVGLEQYADEMNRSRIVVNWPRTETNRSHRIFDSLASGCCLVTGPFPDQGVGLVSGFHYRTYTSHDQLRDVLDELLVNNSWERYAREGSAKVLHDDTWEMRAQELRCILAQELKI